MVLANWMLPFKYQNTVQVVWIVRYAEKNLRLTNIAIAER